MATTHGNPNTYSRLGSVLGFTDNEEDTLKAVYEILTIQRDFGNREDRKFSRLKYTIDKLTVDGFKQELENRIGFQLQQASPYTFTERSDRYGWLQGHDGKWYYTLFVEHGVIKPYQKTFLAELALLGISNFIFTANQNLMLGEISPEDKNTVTALLAKHEIEEETSGLRRNSMACVALPTCPLALAEAQRYLPELVTKLEPLLERHNLLDDDIVIRMTGCPNGCGRPYVAEIGFVGTAAGQYNLMVGGDRFGERLNKLYKEKLDEAQILQEADLLFERFVAERSIGETFGDFTHRTYFLN